jgi:hypothetical protein
MEGGGDASDSVSTNHATIMGGVTFEPALQGQGMRFSGVGSGLLVGAKANAAIDAGSGLTFEAWIKPDSITAAWPVFEWAGSAGPWLWNYSPAGALFLGIGVGGGEYLNTGFAVLRPSVFQHLAFTYNRASGAMTVCSNGVVILNSRKKPAEPAS